MKKAYKYILVFAIMTSFISCDTFLEESPTKSASVVPKSLADYEAILNNYTAFYSEPIMPIMFSTDDYELSTTLFNGFSRAYQPFNAIYGTWNMELAANESSRYSGWPDEWKKIFTANLVLEQIGGVDATAAEKANIIAECHFIRAYSYFVLTNVYCLPYSDATKGELGLPIKASTSFSENIERATLEETFAYIQSDLTKALEIKKAFGKVNNLNNSWRASTAAVNGFAARFYLALNDYALAQTYAQKALDEYNVLRNYNTDMRYSIIPAPATIFNPGPTQVNILYPYTHDQQTVFQDRLEFGEFYYLRMMNNPVWAYWPSQELLGKYDQTYDLRYKYHVVEGYSYTRGAVRPAYDYPGYIFFFKSDIPSGPSVSEMLLIKAECQVRQDKWAEGIATANILRAKRMDASAPANVINLSAASKAEALTKVLDERRRELPFVHRWYDIRRYNNNADTSDDVVMTRTFYPFNSSAIISSQAPVTTTLEKNSRKFAFPIPNEEILIANGKLEQNKY
ncbi:MAG: RagB/SusD family nutrient uptake outer membrane protein [Confluentibacter sp.]|nr:RagB/SusD family nutrient uptake outer membrane protein [Confluentibacter sp.]